MARSKHYCNALVLGFSFPTMKMRSKFTGDMDDMFNVHGHAGNFCREAILGSLGIIINSRSERPPVQPVTIADFGTADGHASLSLVNEMIDVIQTELGENQPIVVYYNDQPMNDFNLLSKAIQGSTYGTGLTLTGNVYPVMIPRTMYEQCLPDNSLDLAISTLATQYLSKQVCQIKNGVSFQEADDSEKKIMRAQGKADWRAFVISRGRELKPGGFLITFNVSSNDDRDLKAPFENGFIPLGRIVSDMNKEGIITQEEYLSTNINAYLGRTAEDFKEPFTSDLPDIKKLGLELVSIRTAKHFTLQQTFNNVNKNTTDKLKYSERIVAMVYPWLHNVLYKGFSNSRTEEEKEMIIDQYFRRFGVSELQTEWVTVQGTDDRALFPVVKIEAYVSRTFVTDFRRRQHVKLSAFMVGVS
ncbi:probable S-adenosylmethionine-dependent methyltransferase At5g38780 [Pecten maximus]|uniref:probable S-adenosylmethionine-dependent methyltransferase At5g38780 n=1 Tax=Pecten maximus TaxID=6579 RepID=UPI0014589D7B|nr:probable S-adenosylmethionine-dependent methyltransferase At5g38780 [Pecten maximus]